MSDRPIRSVAVIDVGASNAKALHFAPDLSLRATASIPVSHRDGPPYRNLDAEAVVAFAETAIRDFDRACPVDAIVPCSHGSALALLDDRGALALPVMSYLAEVPGDIAGAYDEIAPPFAEVLAPTNPGALTLGRQLLWQETHFAHAFARVRTILPYAQYLAYRLSGVPASEVSALGAQTHLWAPRRRAFSSLARARGWDRLFAPLRPAGAVLDTVRHLGLDGRGAVLCGVHDSNANYLRYAGKAPLVLLSTGTWIIAFDSAAALDGLDGGLDQVSNTTVSGEPVACARFMGGEEYARLAGDGASEQPALELVAELIGQGTWARPSFTDSGGPVPGTGGAGRLCGPMAESAIERASLAALYTAQMTSLALNALGTTRRVVVDGPFSRNEVYLALLAALMPERLICRSLVTNGTASGAAMLALGEDAPKGLTDSELPAVQPANVDGLSAYHRNWCDAVGSSG